MTKLLLKFVNKLKISCAKQSHSHPWPSPTPNTVDLETEIKSGARQQYTVLLLRPASASLAGSRNEWSPLRRALPVPTTPPHPCLKKGPAAAVPTQNQARAAAARRRTVSHLVSAPRPTHHSAPPPLGPLGLVRRGKKEQTKARMLDRRTVTWRAPCLPPHASPQP